MAQPHLLMGILEALPNTTEKVVCNLQPQFEQHSLSALQCKACWNKTGTVLLGYAHHPDIAGNQHNMAANGWQAHLCVDKLCS